MSFLNCMHEDTNTQLFDNPLLIPILRYYSTLPQCLIIIHLLPPIEQPQMAYLLFIRRPYIHFYKFSYLFDQLARDYQRCAI